MEMMIMDVEPIKTTVDELLKVLSSQNVIGEKIETEDKIVIPIMKMGMGFGAGSGEGSAPAGRGGGKGSSAAGAAGMKPIAMMVIFKGVKGAEGVKLMHLGSPNAIARAITEVGASMMEMMEKSGMTEKWKKKT
jgi:uncharacterized spore protein YtfJ